MKKRTVKVSFVSFDIISNYKDIVLKENPNFPIIVKGKSTLFSKFKFKFILALSSIINIHFKELNLHRHLK